MPPLTGALTTIGLGSLLLGPWSDRMKVDTGLTGAYDRTMAVVLLLFYKAEYLPWRPLPCLPAAC